MVLVAYILSLFHADTGVPLTHRGPNIKLSLSKTRSDMAIYYGSISPATDECTSTGNDPHWHFGSPNFKMFKNPQMRKMLQTYARWEIVEYHINSQLSLYYLAYVLRLL